MLLSYKQPDKFQLLVVGSTEQDAQQCIKVDIFDTKLGNSKLRD